MYFLKKTYCLLIWVIIVLFWGGCKGFSYYYCTVNSYGKPSLQKNYYLVPIDSSMMDNPFQYLEYKKVLEARLKKLGYVQTDSTKADLRIDWAYYFGDAHYAGTRSSTTTNKYSWSNTSTTSRTDATVSAYGSARTNYGSNTTTANASAYGSSTTNRQSTNNSYGSTVSNTSEQAIYKHDLGCVIMAYDRNTNEPIWMVESIDHGEKESLREYMMWAIVAACSKIGTNEISEVCIQDYEKKDLLREIEEASSVVNSSGVKSRIVILPETITPAFESFRSASVYNMSKSKKKIAESSFISEIDLDLKNAKTTNDLDLIDLKIKYLEQYSTINSGVRSDVQRLKETLSVKRQDLQ